MKVEILLSFVEFEFHEEPIGSIGGGEVVEIEGVEFCIYRTEVVGERGGFGGSFGEDMEPIQCAEVGGIALHDGRENGGGCWVHCGEEEECAGDESHEVFSIAVQC